MITPLTCSAIVIEKLLEVEEFAQNSIQWRLVFIVIERSSFFGLAGFIIGFHHIITRLGAFTAYISSLLTVLYPWVNRRHAATVAKLYFIHNAAISAAHH